MTFLDGIKIGGYRSFNKPVEFSNFQKVNLFIGQNNSGKSNILRFLVRHLQNLKDTPRGQKLVREYDQPVKSLLSEMRVAIQVGSKGETLKRIIAARSLPEDVVRQLLSNVDHYWFPFISKSYSEFEAFNEGMAELAISLGHKDNNQLWYFFFNRLTKMQGGGLKDWLPHVCNLLNPSSVLPEEISFIPAARSIRAHRRPGLVQQGDIFLLDGMRDHSGLDLIEELFKIERPEFGYDKDKERFKKINEFMKEVTSNPSVHLEIPHTKSSVIVNMDGKRLQLESLGAGIEQVLIMAAKATIFSKQIVCIEEPELYLHPTLQRKLLNYLYHETDNQYFIATHSAHLIDAVPSSLYHVQLSGGDTMVTAALTDSSKFLACSDLGYKASDLLQSNCIIWVEGPSDRIYLNHWLSNVAPEFQEGLHYSIMFYGGRLLSHLTVSDEALEDFLALQKLNRNVCILIDSDKSEADETINATKTRIVKEFTKNNHPVWVTAGREIENYIPKSVLLRTIADTHKAVGLPTYGQYKDHTRYWIKEPKNQSNMRSIDKLKVAHEVAAQDADLDVLDLRQRIEEIVEFIRKSSLISV